MPTMKFDFIKMLTSLKSIARPYYFLPYIMESREQWTSLTGSDKASKRVRDTFVLISSVKLPPSKRGVEFLDIINNSFSDSPVGDVDAIDLAVKDYADHCFSHFTDDETHKTKPFNYYFMHNGVIIRDNGTGDAMGFITSNKDGIYVVVYDLSLMSSMDIVDKESKKGVFLDKARAVLPKKGTKVS